MITTIVALFGAGIASFLAPCLIPLVPAYLGAIAGDSDGDRAVGATLRFVAGFATVFALLGGIAGALGSSLSSIESTVQRVGGVVVIVFGLALLGVLRGPFSRERRVVALAGAGRGRSDLVRPYVIGLAFGAGWSPCVGPLLGAALTVAADRGRVLEGVVLLLAYSLGIGVPFVLASLGLASSPRAAARLRRMAPTMERVAGVLLVVLGLLLVTGAYTHLTSYLARFAPSVAGL